MPSYSFQTVQEQNNLGHSFERRAYYYVLEATRAFPIPTYTTHRDIVDRNVNTLLMVNINPIYKR